MVSRLAPGYAFVVRTGIALAMLLTLGCGEDISYEVTTPPPEVDRAITSAAWEVRHLYPITRVVTLEWAEPPCIMHNGRCSGGVAFECDLVVVKRHSVAHSSLAHELLHCWLWRALGDSDPDHSEIEWERERVMQAAIWEWECTLVGGDCNDPPDGTIDVEFD